MDFLDDDTLAVANRGGGVAIFKLPAVQTGTCELSPIQVLEPGPGSIVFTPGSVSVVRGEDGGCELLICKNYADTISRHVVDRNGDGSVLESKVLLRKWLNLPDGVCASRDGRWIAVSNHNSNSILLYDRSDALNGDSSRSVCCGASHFLMVCASVRTAGICFSPTPARRSSMSLHAGKRVGAVPGCPPRRSA